MSAVDLDVEMKEAAKASSLVHAKALIGLGVSLDTVADLRRHHWGWGVTHASDAGDGLYCPGEGPLHLVLPVYEDGELVDLSAFRSADPTTWLLRTGFGWALGLEHGLERLTWGDPVTLYVSPLDWLRAGADGLCVLDWDAPELRYLSKIPSIVCASTELAACLEAALSQPSRLPQIRVMELAHAA